jgi:hypothetical protein
MSQIIYHLGTGTYFGLDDDVVVIDTDEVSEYFVRPIEAELKGIYADEIADYWGKRISHIVTKEDN